MEIQVYTKIVKELELNITQITSDNGISPKLMNYKIITDDIITIDGNKYNRNKFVKDNENLYEMSTELYEETLIFLPQKEWLQYKEQLLILLRKLHSLGIIHTDITEENIVVNTSTKEARLIDFGYSKFVKNVNISELSDFVFGFPVDNEEELFKLEEDMLLSLLHVYENDRAHEERLKINPKAKYIDIFTGNIKC